MVLAVRAQGARQRVAVGMVPARQNPANCASPSRGKVVRHPALAPTPAELPAGRRRPAALLAQTARARQITRAKGTLPEEALGPPPARRAAPAVARVVEPSLAQVPSALRAALPREGNPRRILASTWGLRTS